MLSVFLILLPIALLDSTSIVPICIVPLIILLSGPNPVGRSAALLFGVFLIYVIVGLLILFGLRQAFDAIDAYVLRVWQHPNAEELIFEIIVGIVLVVLGVRMALHRRTEREKPTPSSMTGLQAFFAGVVMAIVGLPGAVPYLAAIDLIIRSNLSIAQSVVLIGLYNVVFVAPLIGIVVLRLALGDRSEAILDRTRSFLSRWGRRAVIFLMIAFGLIFVADGIGWFLGMPLIPV
ncbi:MAG: GAP family protein [Pseudomonadota bacterium]